MFNSNQGGRVSKGNLRGPERPESPPVTAETSGSVWELLAILSEEYENNRRDWTRPGFRAIAVYRFGVWAMMRDRSTFLRKQQGRLLDILHMIAHRYIRNHHGIELHRTAQLGRGVKFSHWGGIVIHNYAHIGDRCHIGHGVTMGSAGRGVTRDQAPRLEADVRVSTGVVILGKVTIGEGARIGPNVVLYTDIPKGATVVANSPRIIYAPNARRANTDTSNESEQ